MGDLDGKIALVTGAERYRSMGRQIALALAGAGADLAVTGMHQPPDAALPDEETELSWTGLESTAAEIRSMGRRALALRLDVSDAADVEKVIEATLAEFGRIDVLVNTAAVPIGPDRVAVVDLDEAVWRRLIDVNLTGAFLITRAVARVLVQQGDGGKIVNLSSVLGKTGRRHSAAYAASKFGIIGFTQSLAIELAPHHVNVNAVCPGIIATYRTRGVTENEESAARTLRLVPWGRMGTPEDVAQMVKFLCSHQADYLTGQSINVDGGWVMH